MQTIRRKLNSESGASIVIALVFFLLCLTVGAIVLTAATANAGRVSRIQKEQQAYFAVRSAAALLRDEIEGSTFHGRYEEYVSGTKSTGRLATPIHALTAGLENMINLHGRVETDAKNVFQFRYEGVTADGRSQTLTIAVPDMLDVEAKYIMDENFTITVQLDTTDEKYRYPMTLTFRPALSAALDSATRQKTHRWEETKTETDTETGEEYTYSESFEMVTDYTDLTVFWQTGVITKGAGG